MGAPHRIGPVIAITGTSLMVGCGGNYGSYGSCGSYGSYGSYGGCAAPLADPAGIYEGVLSSATSPQSQSVVTIIAENGEGRMSGVNDTYYRLNVDMTTNGNVNGTFVGYSQSGNLPNGTQTSSGSLGGVVTPANLNATLTDATNTRQTLALNFDNAYNLTSALATLAGNWTASANGLTLTATIQPDGSFAGSDSNNCTYAGAFSLIDPNFNTYAETHVRSCNGVDVTFTGLAAYFPGSGSGTAGTPTEIKLLTDNDAGEYLVAQLE